MSRRIINNAIQKFYSIPDLDYHGVPTVNLLKVGKEGPDKPQLDSLELSKEELEKSGVKFKPGNAYIHVITLGAGESYGPNLKADYYHESPRSVTFPEAPGVSKDLGPGIKDNHCTFMDAEGVYRHHDYSKPPEGNVVFERYNTPMHRGELILELPLSLWEDDLQKQSQGHPLRFSQGCFTAGALVKTSMGYKPVEEITTADYITTHTGKSVQVKNTQTLYLQDAPMNTIKVAGGVETTSTDYHLYFVVKRNLLQPGLRYLEDCDIQANGEWVQAKNVQEGDFVVMPFETGTEVIDDVSPELAKLAGYYLAEGNVLYSDHERKNPIGLQFTGHKDEPMSYILPNLCKKLGTKPPRKIRYRQSKGVGFFLYDKGITQVFIEWFGIGSKTKYISDTVLKWPLELQKNLLGTYLDGDGYCSLGTENQPKFNIMANTASKELAFGLQLLFARLGDATGILKEVGRTSKSLNTPLGYTVNYKLRCSRDVTKQLSPYCEKIPYDCGTGHSRTGDRRIYRNYILAKVKKNKSYVGNEVVYDIHVEDEDHSYTVNNMSVHNSSVVKDCCSICGFEYSAKKPERCDHIKNHKLEIYPDGTQAYVYNPNPRFYEISEVGDRPADKIAFCLRKVAEDGDSMKSKQELGLSLPRSKQGTLYIVSSTPDKKKVLNKLRDHHHRMSIMPTEHDVQAVKACSMKPEEQEDVVSKLSPLEWNELLPGLRSKKCMLTPQVWHAIVSNTKSGSKFPDVREFEDALHSVIENMNQDVQEDILDDTDYSSLPFSVTESARSLIQPIQSRLSLDPIRAALRPSDDKQVSLIIVKKGEEPSPVADFLAREYVKYQTEVLTEIGSSDEGAIYLAAANTKTRSYN